MRTTHGEPWTTHPVEAPEEGRVRVVRHVVDGHVRETVDDHDDEVPDGRRPLPPDEQRPLRALVEHRPAEAVVWIVVRRERVGEQQDDAAAIVGSCRRRRVLQQPRHEGTEAVDDELGGRQRRRLGRPQRPLVAEPLRVLRVDVRLAVVRS